MAGLLESFFVGKRVLITGACRGMGRAMAEKVHKMGAETIALSNNADRLNSLKKEFPKIQTVCVDLHDWDKTEAAIKQLDVIHCLVNNAGADCSTTFWTLKPKAMNLMVGVNVMAPLNISQIVAAKMIEKNIPGSIVNISSEVGNKPQLRNVGYSLSKASLNMLTKVMAYELGKHKIRVNGVAPGAVLTPLLSEGCDEQFKCAKGEGIEILKKTLLKRHRMPTGEVFVGIDDIVNTTLFLLTDLAPMMIGETILVDAGQHLT